MDPGRENLLRLLAELSGRSLRTRADVTAFLAQEMNKSGTSSVGHRWQVVKKAVLTVGLALSFLQYYFLDIYAQIAALPQVVVLASVTR